MRGHMDASEYKHICLGLIFLKYISDAFKEKREQLLFGFSDPKSKDVLGRVYEYEKFASAEGTLQLAKSSRSNRRKSDRAQAPPPGKWRG
jgi:type I restriction-modification system DNA methylase subunit